MHHLGAERRKPVGRNIARRYGIFAVPREREHFHARVGRRMEAIERTFDERAAFNREHAGAFSGRDDIANVTGVAHLFDKRRMLGELRLEEIANDAKNLPAPIGRHMIGNERREALAPGILGFRHAVERDVAIVVRERRHARIGNRGVLLHETSVGERLMQSEPVERVAMQVENIRRCGFKWHNRSPLLDAAGWAERRSARYSALGTRIRCDTRRSAPRIRCVRSIVGHDSPVFSAAGFSKAMRPPAHPIPIRRRERSFCPDFPFSGTNLRL